MHSTIKSLLPGVKSHPTHSGRYKIADVDNTKLEIPGLGPTLTRHTFLNSISSNAQIK